MLRSLAIAVFLALGAVSGLAAQARATAGLSVAVPIALRLQTVTTVASTVAVAPFRQVAGAVVLRVSANCAWRLVAVVPAGGPALEARAAVAGRTTAGFEPLADGTPVATGGRGRAIEVVVDYRLPPEGGAPPSVSYRLEPAGE